MAPLALKSLLSYNNNVTNKHKILIIDDDEFLLDMYSTKFRETGFETEIAFNSSEALEKINQGFQPDIVLLDIIMPQMDGFAFLENFHYS